MEPAPGQFHHPDGFIAKYLRSMSARSSFPFPIAPTQIHDISSASYIKYFRSIWTSLTTAIYPAVDGITQDDFVLMCRHLLVARLNHVNAEYYDGRSLAPGCSVLPLSLSNVLNGIGVVTTHEGGVVNVPRYGGEPADNELTSTTAAIESGFANLILACKVRDSMSEEVATGNNNDVIVRASFKEWTPKDALYASIVQNGATGVSSVDKSNVWHSNYISNVLGMRHSFNLGV
ncbi:uncharacterized protein LOC122507449 [Leptopilina heterotoma]|uniref:uncharacterized protein LOC122507449 n=1 Tax=Leptopilina heterotoma TaxID=63436 RepID=UPI001CA9471A|nr:uncharacterized protein LOC122507449 [Leptopilina heterotoma]